jgi:hypothetical protein
MDVSLDSASVCIVDAKGKIITGQAACAIARSGDWVLAHVSAAARP